MLHVFTDLLGKTFLPTCCLAHSLMLPYNTQKNETVCCRLMSTFSLSYLLNHLFIHKVKFQLGQVKETNVSHPCPLHFSELPFFFPQQLLLKSFLQNDKLLSTPVILKSCITGNTFQSYTDIFIKIKKIDASPCLKHVSK